MGGLLLATELAAPPPPESEGWWLALGGFVFGYLAVVSGLILGGVRALRVRRALPAHRYRGPAILALLVLSVLLALPPSLLFAPDLTIITGGAGEPSLLGSTVLLTATQLALLAVAFGLVFVPGALPGLRLLPMRGTGRSLATGIAVGVPLWLVATTVGAGWAYLLTELGIEAEPQVVEQAISRIHPAIIIGSIVVLTPLAEELFFRGVVLNAWWREYGWPRAWIGSSVLWTLIHGSLLAFVPILIVGLALAQAYRRTRSLLTTVGMHATFNAITVVLTLAVNRGLISLPD